MFIFDLPSSGLITNLFTTLFFIDIVPSSFGNMDAF